MDLQQVRSGRRLLRLAAVIAAAASLAAAPSAVDVAFNAFWTAPNPEAAARAIEAVVKTNVPFADAYARLKRGREYRADVPRGIVHLSHHFALGDFNYTLDVPPAYDPSRRYQVRVQLHGGVTGRENGEIRGNGSIGQLAGVEQIYVLPIAWQDAPWWSNAQLENMRAILDSLKRTYNVDENHVVLSGTSDGATANYYFAMRDMTPFASFLTLNGALAVLQNTSMKIDGELFPQNLVNKPFFMVNGARDPLYPPDVVEPYIDHMKKNGVEVVYHQQPDGVHNTTWWPEEKDAFEAFVRDHPRRPLPDRLTWETDMTGGTNRADWLVIDRLASNKAPDAAAMSSMPDLNIYRPDLLGRFGVKAEGATIARVIGGSSASTFLFEPGDVVTSVQGKAVAKDADLGDVFAGFKEGRLTIDVLRAGKPEELFGFYKAGEATAGPLFDRTAPSGRVDLVRQGNTVTATTKNVAEFTLLLSPDAFDFSKPIRVVADGKTVFDGRVRPSLQTLMKWAAHDNDRTLLFGAELPITVK
jgi:pimeloyl-ACP methyl ester carboxylesterase